MEVNAAQIFYISATIAIWLFIITAGILTIKIIGMMKAVRRTTRKIGNAAGLVEIVKDSIWVNVLSILYKTLGGKGGERNVR